MTRIIHKDHGQVALVPVEATDSMKEAAFGPIMHGGRGGPVTADFIRQSAALSTQKAMLAAAPADPQADVVALHNATENLLIAIGMGWDLDGVVAAAKDALAKFTLGEDDAR